MNRLQAIQMIIGRLRGDEWIVCANGAISRETFSCRDRRENFYLLGSMGLSSAVGLGMAVSRPEKRIIIMDGDGNILMGLGNLAMVGAIKPANFIHFVLDNQAYGTTGNQPSISSRVSLYEIAKSSGYAASRLLRTLKELEKLLAGIDELPRPLFAQILVSRDVPVSCPRIPYSARQMKERFADAARGQKEKENHDK